MTPESPPEITVHHLERSRSTRILWLLEELGLPYTLQRYARDPETLRAPASLRAVHPLGKAPVVTLRGLTDGEATLAESGAILEGLLDRFGAESGLRPPAGTPETDRFRYWLHFAEGSLMPPLLVALIFGRLRTAPLPFFLKPIVRAIAGKVDAAFTVPEITRLFDFLEGELARAPYLVGAEFTAADIQLSYPVEAAVEGGRVSSPGPATRAWLDRIRARPAYGRAIERGGPVSL